MITDKEHKRHLKQFHKLSDRLFCMMSSNKRSYPI